MKIEVIKIVLEGLLLPLLILGLKLLNDRIKDKRILSAKAVLDNMIITVFKETTQTFVEELKKKGEFGKEEALQAMEITFKRTTDMVGDKLVKTLKDYIPNISEYVVAKVEELASK